MYVRDLHSDLSSAMARHSLKLTGSPLHFRAFVNVRPHVISGNPFGLESDLFWRLHFSVAICHSGVSLYFGEY